ncbi:MAG: hypothetical protein GY862_31045 [Gammaproteobacteria bacterium]|nr:hypothetical protein [Gammaproteobacteria bacterium]
MLLNTFKFLTVVFLLACLTACPGGGGGGGSSEIDIGVRASSVILTVGNNFQLADGSAEITLTVLVRDARDQPMANAEVSLTSTSGSAIIAEPTGITEASGSFTTTVTNTLAETFQITPAAGGMRGEPVSVTFGDGAIDSRVATVTLTVSDNFQVADGVGKITLAVVARDSENTPLADVNASLDSTPNSAFFDAVAGTTDSHGQFTARLTSNMAETFEVTPSAGGKQGDPASVTFIAYVEDIELNAAQQVLAVNDTATVTATVLECFASCSITSTLVGDPLPNTPFNAVVSGSAVLTNVPARTDASGKAVFGVTDNKAEDVTLTVTSGLVTRTLRLYFGASLQILPDSVNATGSATLKALLKDGRQAPLPGQTVEFNFIGENSETMSPTRATTGADGTAEVTITDLGEDGGTVTVSAGSGLLEARSTVFFLAALGQGRTLEVSTSATVLNRYQSAVITAVIEDKAGVPVNGQSVRCSAGGSTRLSVAEGVTDADGQIQTTVSNTVGEDVLVTVRAGAAAQEISLYFGTVISLTSQQANGNADGTTAVALTASVRNAQGMGIPGIQVSFRASGSALLDGYRLITDETGQVKVNMTNTVVESVTVKAWADNLAPAEININFSVLNSGQPASIILNIDRPEPFTLSLNESVEIIATVLDEQNNPVKNGTQVNFITNGIGSVTASGFTRDGKATVIFNAGTTVGQAIVTAATEVQNRFFDESSELIIGTGDISAGISITVEPRGEIGGKASIIEVHSIKPEAIGIKGSGIVQISTIQFMVKDDFGNSIPDDTAQIKFSFGTSTGGGETISTVDGETISSSLKGVEITDTTINGLVSIILKSGMVAGPVDVIASIEPERNQIISTLARVIIVSGLPDADHLSLAAEFLNIAGGVTFGLQDRITAFVGDRYGNIVPDGTQVSFITEGGTIGQSPGAGAFTSTTALGQASAILQTEEPAPPSLGGVPPEGNVGLSRVVAYTPGSESYVDVNGDGNFDVGIDRFSDPGFIDVNDNDIWDIGEPITNRGDMSEPFIDGNDNHIFDSGELYIDVNQNGFFNGPNGSYEANTTVWTSMNILFSARPAPIQVMPASFCILNGGVQRFTVNNIGDAYGNALAEGTTFTVEAIPSDILGGETEFTFPDSKGPGETSVTFTVKSLPGEVVSSIGPDGETFLLLEYPLPDSATITISISSPDTENSPGGNGEVSQVISGDINVNKDSPVCH